MNELFQLNYLSGFFGLIGFPIQMLLSSILAFYVLFNPILIDLTIVKSEKMRFLDYILEIILRWQYTTLLALFVSISPIILAPLGGYFTVSIGLGTLFWLWPIYYILAQPVSNFVLGVIYYFTMPY